MPRSTFFTSLSQSSRVLLDACAAVGLQAQREQPGAGVLLLSSGANVIKTLNADSAAEMIKWLRTGGRLLITVDWYTADGLFWLSSVLPSTGWTTTVAPSAFTSKTPIAILPSDKNFFSSPDLGGLAVLPGVDLRPVSAVERGQSRYERYAIKHSRTKAQIAPHTDLWSRPLLNREWTSRAVYTGLQRLPLLVTGRYGAGRVAMIAVPLPAVGESPAAGAFWRDVLRWLTVGEDEAPSASDDHAALEIRFPAPGRVTLNCSGSGSAQLVVRMTDQDGAMLADGKGEFSRIIMLKAGKPTIIELSLPAAAVPGLEAREPERRLWVRAGLLSGDGSMLLAEQRLLSPVAPLRVRVATQNLALQGKVFPGPGPETLQSFTFRMGLPVNVYAAPPATRLEGTVSVSLECENLALEGVWKDLADPGNGSVTALNDRGGVARRGPIDGIQGWGMWTGHSSIDNALELILPFAARLSAVTLVGSHGSVGGFEIHNPGQAIVEVDGRQVARVDDLDSVFTAGLGQARIALAPGSVGRTVIVHLPWTAMQNGRGRGEPWLGEILVEGWPNTEPPASPVSGQLAVELVPALGGSRIGLMSTVATIRPGELVTQSFAVPLPAANGVAVYRLEAAFHPASHDEAVIATAPLLTIAPRRTFKDLLELTGPTVLGTGMNVTNGFTKFISLGTGTSEPWNGWAHPDDLIWAYARQFKEIWPNARTAANRLYATETDMRHYSMPWREFCNGEMFFSTAVPGLIAGLKQERSWAKAQVVRLTFGDRWVVGPDLGTCNGWQEFVAFDGHLRQTTGRGLVGRTRAEVYAEIHASHETEWQAWQLERYLGSVRSIREAFRAEGKDVFLYSQELPVVAGAPGHELSQFMRGMNDDYTWGMQDNNPTLTTGRNLGELAFNPVWRMSTLMAWGFASPVFNNWQWHDPVSTTEPVRRLLYNRTWRGMLWDDGHYGALATYGYSVNVGPTYTMAAEEYQEWWNMQQRGNLLQPESPLGAGLVISTQKAADPRTVRWNCNNALSLVEPRLIMLAFRSLSEAGLSVPFAANAAQLGRWTPPPGAALIVLNLPDWSEDEITGLAKLQAQGVPVAAFAMRSSLSPTAARIFDQPGTLLLERAADELSPAEAVTVARQLADGLRLAVQFSDGLNGYGFRCGDLSMVVVEDWREQARLATVRLRKSPDMRRAAAANLNDHSTLAVTDAGIFWEIAVPIRSGDGAMIAVKEF